MKIRHETSDQFFIEPSHHNQGGVLVIDRLSQEIKLIESSKNVVPTSAKSKPIFGIVGTIRLLAGQYLVVITKCSKAGAVNSQKKRKDVRIKWVHFIDFT